MDTVKITTPPRSEPPIPSGVEAGRGGSICGLCAHAAEHGWWGDDLPTGYTHCRDCHVTFPASNKWGHCSACHNTFAGIDAFDRHQRTSRDGEIAENSLCWALTPGQGEESTLERPSQLSWEVNETYTLEKRRTDWGTYWARLTDPFAAGEVFGRSPA